MLRVLVPQSVGPLSLNRLSFLLDNFVLVVLESTSAELRVDLVHPREHLIAVHTTQRLVLHVPVDVS